MKEAALGLVLALALATPAMAYEVITVSNGGSVKGKVVVKGKAPKDETLKIGKDTKVCGTSQPAGKYVISAKGEVKNVLVIVEDIKKGKAAPKQDMEIDNKKCKFEPLVGLAYKGSKFIIKNSDPLFHNTNLGLMKGKRRRTLYNLALPKQGQVIKKKVKASGFVATKCDAHKWMRAFAYASKHPYVAITGKDGSFEIKDLPPGKYTLKIWHEGLGEQKQTVEVKAGKATAITVQYK